MTLPLRAALAGAMAILALAGRARAEDPPPESPPPAAQEPAPAAPASSARLRTTTGDTEEDEDDEDAASAPGAIRWGLGARMRYINVPQALLDIFVEHSTPMRSYSVAAELTRRKAAFDITISLEYADVSPDDGLWQEKGEDSPGELGMYPDYVDFRNLALLSADISFIWHLPIADWIAFRYGAGIGLGVPLGAVKHQDTTCRSNTSVDDLDDPNACDRVGRLEDADIPPIVPIANVLVGFRFRLVDQLSLQIEGGWRFPALFVGAGVGYFF